MPFQIAALSPDPFRPPLALSDEALAEQGAVRRTADARPGYACRVSLEDAPVGESVLLLNYEHQPAATPYRASHAIFVREGAGQARPGIGEMPEALRRRLLSLRAFDAAGMMLAADVVEGAGAAPAIDALLADPAAAYRHLYHARQGCYAARADRA